MPSLATLSGKDIHEASNSLIVLSEAVQKCSQLNHKDFSTYIYWISDEDYEGFLAVAKFSNSLYAAHIPSSLNKTSFGVVDHFLCDAKRYERKIVVFSQGDFDLMQELKVPYYTEVPIELW